MSNPRNITIASTVLSESMSDRKIAVGVLSEYLHSFFGNDCNTLSEVTNIEELADSIWAAKGKPKAKVLYFENNYFSTELRVICRLTRCGKMGCGKLIFFVDLEDQIESSGIHKVECFVRDLKEACPPSVEFQKNF